MPVIKQKAVKKNRIFKAAVILVVLAAAVISAVIISDSFGVSLKETQTVVIESGMGAKEIAGLLSENGIIKSRLLFEAAARKGGYSSRLMPGSLKIEDGMSYSQILENICTPGRDALDNRSDNALVIPEGYELRQIRDEFVRLGICTAEEFDAAADPSLYDYAFLEGLPERDNPLEGYLFPDTYYFEKNDSARDVIDMMLKNFDEHFTQKYYNRAAELNMSVDDIIILASIIERETDSENERAKVAGVFYNRLKTGMALQSCATVQYILQERKPVLSVADTKIESPYNTYLHKGLPVGPIASPGMECINAALYPEDTDALYFVMGKDGKHIFSKTYEEHLAASEQAQN